MLFGATRREVLALLLGRPDQQFYLREIVRAAGGASGAVQRELKQLVEAGLVEREVRGPHVYYSATRTHRFSGIFERSSKRRRARERCFGLP